MDLYTLVKAAMEKGPWFVVTLLSLLITYEAVRSRHKKGGN